MRNLGERLETAYKYLAPGREAWDSCCDHGELGRKALSSSLFSDVHFVDRVPHLIARIQSGLSTADAQAHIHLADVCKEDLKPEGNLVFVGIGAQSMIAMLEKQCPDPKEGIRLIRSRKMPSSYSLFCAGPI